MRHSWGDVIFCGTPSKGAAPLPHHPLFYMIYTATTPPLPTHPHLHLYTATLSLPIYTIYTFYTATFPQNPVNPVNPV